MNPDALIRYVGFLFVSAVLVLAGSWWSKKNALLAGAVVAIGYAVLAGDLWPLFVAIWFAIASTLLGQAILGALRLSVKNERFLIRFLVGAGVYDHAGLL